MSLTDRDRKVLLIVVPLVVLIGYWFLLLAPKREEASKAGTELSEQQQARDRAQAELDKLQRAKTSFAADYAQLVRLGKAIPSSVDMPSLLVQLDKAARGTGIKFKSVATGDRQAASPAPAPAAGGGAGGSGGTGATPAGSTPAGGPAPPGGSSSNPAAGGGAPAQSAAGQATESASNSVDSANSKNGAAENVTPQDTQTSQQARDGKLPVGGAAGGSSGPAAAAGSCAPGLECIPLEFEFDGGFFDLADFFHRLKRFVEGANDKVLVRGRLLTIDNLKFSSGDVFPKLKAEIKATVYLAPKGQGTTAGASPQGPPATTPASGTPAPQPGVASGSAPAPGTAPASTGTP